jgi:hypothetical protein
METRDLLTSRYGRFLPQTSYYTAALASPWAASRATGRERQYPLPSEMASVD